jgi:hypothetical protein
MGDLVKMGKFSLSREFLFSVVFGAEVAQSLSEGSVLEGFLGKGRAISLSGVVVWGALVSRSLLVAGRAISLLWLGGVSGRRKTQDRRLKTQDQRLKTKGWVRSHRRLRISGAGTCRGMPVTRGDKKRRDLA